METAIAIATLRSFADHLNAHLKRTNRRAVVQQIRQEVADHEAFATIQVGADNIIVEYEAADDAIFLWSSRTGNHLNISERPKDEEPEQLYRMLGF